MTRRDLAPDLAPTSPRRCHETTSPLAPSSERGEVVATSPPHKPPPPPAPPRAGGVGVATSPRDLAPTPRRRHLNRTARNYLDWLDRGGRSDHLPRVLAALDHRPRTRREIADRAAVSIQYATVALAVLDRLGHARPAGTGKHRAKLYVRTGDEATT